MIRGDVASTRQERKAAPSSQFLEFLFQLTSMTLWIDFKASYRQVSRVRTSNIAGMRSLKKRVSLLPVGLS